LILSEINARDIKSKVLPDKIRIFCNVPEKEDAKTLYTTLHKSLEEPLKCSIFLDLEEEVFVKFGDIEAKRYEEFME
jgi:hypothetical protein